MDNLERLKSKYKILTDPLFSNDSLEKHLTNLEKYENEKGKKIYLLNYDEQREFAKQKFFINQLYEKNSIEKKVSEDVEKKLLEGIIDLPWDYFHYVPWEHIIVDDIYYSIKTYRDWITIWAADFTKPKGMGRIGRSDEVKSSVYFCDVIGLEEDGRLKTGLANFYHPDEHFFGMPYEFTFRESPKTKYITYKKFPVYYGILKGVLPEDESKVKKFVGYPKKETHFRMA